VSWTYLGAPGTSSAEARRDAVRYFIKDTVSTKQLVLDEEIAFVLAENGNNVYRAAADACRGLAAREAKSKSVGDLSISGMGESYVALAAILDRRADMQATPFAGGVSLSDKDTRVADTDRVQPAFRRSFIFPSCLRLRLRFA